MLVIRFLPFLALIGCAGQYGPLVKQPSDSQEKPSEKEIIAIIERLVDMGEGDVSPPYALAAGGSFDPLPAGELPGSVWVFPPDIGPRPKMWDSTFPKLVAAGIIAVPHLVAHLGDKRETKIKVDQGDGFTGGLYFREEYDKNQRTWKGKEERGKRDRFRHNNLGERGTAHTVTVGDMCFVALGQIVNREFIAMYYQPSSIHIVNSTSRSEPLRNRVVQEWGKLTEEGHRRSLEDDALTPDSRWRRVGALVRLSYYYPDAADAVALRVLRLPCYDNLVVDEFLRNTLYEEADASKWKGLIEAFVSKRTPVFRDGVLVALLEDAEVGRKEQAKLRLEALFPKPTRPDYMDSMETYELANCIYALTWHRSSKVDDEVLTLFRGLKGDGLFKDHSEDYLALACIHRLHRVEKFDAELAEYCRRRIPRAGPYRGWLEKAMSKLEK